MFLEEEMFFLHQKKQFIRCLFFGNHIALAILALSIGMATLSVFLLWPYHWTLGCLGIGLSAYVMYSAYGLNTETLRTYLAVIEFLEKPGLSQDEAIKRTLRTSRNFGYCGIQVLTSPFAIKV